MKEKILKAWREWHSDVDLEIMPLSNPSFDRGFKAGYVEGTMEILSKMSNHNEK